MHRPLSDVPIYRGPIQGDAFLTTSQPAESISANTNHPTVMNYFFRSFTSDYITQNEATKNLDVVAVSYKSIVWTRLYSISQDF